MTNYDEYQKFMRYKYGYHSFAIILILTVLNFNLDLIFNLQWAETKSLEFMLLIFLAIGYSIVMNIYKGAYFSKKQNPKIYAVIFFFLGLANIYLSFSPYSPLISDGLVTSNSMMLVSGLLWISIPVAYLTRIIVEKKRDEKDND
ncbi:hypothetical protein [Alkalibacterium sp. 20]|uniref:hypothetical protein n=1 Tax=Alkalibacterium sp. 20 TaxID=1798803 RepID=UPI00090049E8|nr:hypothetical protein [Alkalibacterium sp. 20]OJF90777.1 hypothetical protein AX762_11560 [Alkalibacterium sp. 20]